MRKDQEAVVQKIRSQYTTHEPDALSELKSLDAKVKKPALVFAYVFGTIGALIMGLGMSFVMTDLGKMLYIEEPLMMGVAVGLVGMFMVLLTGPIYKKIWTKRKNKYAAKILELSETMMEENTNE